MWLTKYYLFIFNYNFNKTESFFHAAINNYDGKIFHVTKEFETNYSFLPIIPFSFQNAL